MTQSNAQPAKGTLVYWRGRGTSDEYVKFAEVKDIQPPGATANVEDVTTQDSDGDAHEMRPTTIQSQQISFEINYVPGSTSHGSSVGGIYYNINNKVPLEFKWVYPSAAFGTADGWVIDFKPTAPVAGILSGPVILQLTGPITHP